VTRSANPHPALRATSRKGLKGRGQEPWETASPSWERGDREAVGKGYSTTSSAPNK